MKKQRPFIVTIRVPVLANGVADARGFTELKCQTACEFVDAKPLTRRNKPEAWRNDERVLHKHMKNVDITVAECLQGVPK